MVSPPLHAHHPLATCLSHCTCTAHPQQLSFIPMPTLYPTGDPTACALHHGDEHTCPQPGLGGTSAAPDCWMRVPEITPGSLIVFCCIAQGKAGLIPLPPPETSRHWQLSRDCWAQKFLSVSYHRFPKALHMLHRKNTPRVTGTRNQSSHFIFSLDNIQFGPIF